MHAAILCNVGQSRAGLGQELTGLDQLVQYKSILLKQQTMMTTTTTKSETKKASVRRSDASLKI